MTQHGYAEVTGLIERSAAAYAGAIPDDPADDGFFGAGSIAWRLSGDLSSPIAGLRSLMMQALHPLAMAGVDQHSDWRRDPVGRLAATSAYVTTITFGERRAAQHAAARVRRIHEHVTGTDPVTGRPYEASDPALLLWVHAALVDSGIRACELFGDPLTPEQNDAYVAEMVAAAELVGVPAGQVPSNAAELQDYITSVQPDLRCTPAASESMTFLLDPPGLDEDVAEIWQDVRAGAVASLPPWALALYGWPAEPVTPARRTQIRQALGVLDAVMLGEPGVLEARQRVTLRARANRHA
jgi:uncharacterized protein (DUF2236 family)